MPDRPTPSHPTPPPTKPLPSSSTPAPSSPQSSHQGEPAQPLQPPLPPAQSSPPRQEGPLPSPQPDPPRQQDVAYDRDLPTTLTPEQASGIATTPNPPRKYKRPLPQPGDNDYVVGQPANEEEAARVEREDQERYDRAVSSGKELEARQARPNNPNPRSTHEQQSAEREKTAHPQQQPPPSPPPPHPKEK